MYKVPPAAVSDPRARQGTSYTQHAFDIKMKKVTIAFPDSLCEIHRAARHKRWVYEKAIFKLIFSSYSRNQREESGMLASMDWLPSCLTKHNHVNVCPPYFLFFLDDLRKQINKISHPHTVSEINSHKTYEYHIFRKSINVEVSLVYAICNHLDTGTYQRQTNYLLATPWKEELTLTL